MKNKRLNRSIAFVMALFLAFNMAPAAVRAGENHEADNKAAESENIQEQESRVTEEITISSVEEFAEFAENCYIDSWSADKIINLTCNLNFLNKEVPVVPVFCGTFNGNGYTISGVNLEGTGYVTALFRYVEEEGVIDGLTVKGNITSTDEEQCIGGIAGINYGTIKNCNFHGTVSGMTTIGGIAAMNKGTGTISKCTVQGRITGYYFTGGVVGKNHGVINSCTNLAGVNDNNAWVEEDDEMNVDIIGAISGSSEPSIHTGVDTGGIAGFSDGIIAGCLNGGQIGYEHTGYNVGGIAGRQSGIISLCVNEGTVYGRKDIGGIAGQMEPYIEVIEAETLRSAVNELHDLLEKTLDDMKAGKDVANGDLDELQQHADQVLDTGKALADELAEFADSNMAQLDLLAERFEYVSDCLPGILDNISYAMDALTRVNEDLKRINEDTDISGKLEGNSGDYEKYQNAREQIDNGIDRLGAAVENTSSEKLDAILKDENGENKGWRELTEEERKAVIEEVLNILENSEEIADAAADILDGLSTLEEVVSPYIDTAFDSVHEDVNKATEDLSVCTDYMKNAVDGVRGIVNYLNAQSDIRFTRLSDEFDTNRENLYNELKDISTCITILRADTSEYSDLVNEDMKAVNDKLNEILNLVIDKLEAYSEFNTDGVYEDVSDEALEISTTGKVDSCTNLGTVEGDINVGGIAGAMAIDEEDLEGNAAGQADITIGSRYLTKCVINNSRNEGSITAKKDGAGGIVGFMNLGIVRGSKAYGSVESTEGGYVGGIAGESKTIIRNSYALCYVAGGKYVGGIAGFGDTIKDCYSMVYLDARIGRAGAIAGSTTAFEDEEVESGDKLLGNYYVDNGVHGINGISYAGVAEPILYQDLLKVKGIPSGFRHLKVTYRVDNLYLGEEILEYGESLQNLHFPEFPEKEGYYGVWPDLTGQFMTGSIVIEGKYVENVLVVDSGERPQAAGEGSDKAYALVADIFTADTVLHADLSSRTPPAEAEGKEYVVYDVSVDNSGLTDTSPLTLRLLNPYEKGQVYYYHEGAWTRLDSLVRGSYLQVTILGTGGTFCIAEEGINLVLIAAIAGGAAVFILFAVIVSRLVKKHKNRKCKG